MRADIPALMRALAYIERANIFSAACRRAVSQGKASAAQVYAAAAAGQRRAALRMLGVAI